MKKVGNNMKTKLLLYCTKRKPYLFNRIIKGKSDGYYTDIVPYDIEDEYLNGKIVAECECEVEEIAQAKLDNGVGYDYIYDTDTLLAQDFVKKSCLDNWDLLNYFGYFHPNGEIVGYALHLTNIKAFEKPLELSEVEIYNKNGNPYLMNTTKPLTKAPQNMCRVWYKGEEYVLISIRPEWLCKILNGEKTIEVRRKILKGML